MDKASDALVRISQKPVAEVEKNVYSLAFDDQIPEVVLVRKNVKRFACDCVPGKANQPCYHVVTLLFALRRKIRRENAKKTKKSTPRRNKSKKYALDTLLKTTELEALQAFVKEYARKDKRFEQALKIRFATQHYEDEGLGQTDFVKLMLQPYLNRKNPMGKREAQQVSKHVNEFLLQAEMRLASRSFQFVADICTQLIEVLPIIFYRNPVSFEIMEENWKATFQLLRNLLGEQLAPQLHEGIYDFLLSKFDTTPYNKVGLIIPFFEVFLEVFEKEIASDDDFYGKLVQKIQVLHNDHTLQNQWIIFKIKFHFLLNNRSAAFQTFEQYAERPTIKTFAFTYQGEAADIWWSGLADYFQNHPITPKDIPYFVKHFTQNKQTTKAIEWQLKLCLMTRRIKHFELLIALDPSLRHSYSSVYDNLYHKFADDARLTLLASVLEKAERSDALLEMLTDLGRLDLLYNFDEGLWKDRPEETLALYKDLLFAFLENYVGPQNAGTVNAVVKRLYSKDFKHGKRIQKEILEKYGDRSSLKSELLGI